MKYDADCGKLVCMACDLQRDVDDGGAAVEEWLLADYSQREERALPFYGVETFSCAACGAQIDFHGDEAAKLCPMCSSPQIGVGRLTAGIPPDSVVPFKIEKNAAQEMFKKWITERFFAPSELKRSYQEGRLQGVYLPFWTFDAVASGRYFGRGGVVKEDKGGEKKVVWTFVSGELSMNFDDVAVCATTGDGVKLASKVMPFGTRISLPYSPEYLSGYSAQRYRGSALNAFEWAKDEMHKRLELLASNNILMRGFTEAEVTRIDVEFENVKYKQVLVPVWTSSFIYRGEKYSYAINGETGRVAGEYPKSAVKIAAAVIAVAAIIYALCFGGSRLDTGSQGARRSEIILEHGTFEATDSTVRYSSADGVVYYDMADNDSVRTYDMA